MGADLTPSVVPAACPACGGPGCDKCSHTGEAEFAAADAAFAMVLEGTARTEEEIAEMLVLADGLADRRSRQDYGHGYVDGVAATIRWITGEDDDPPIPFSVQ